MLGVDNSSAKVELIHLAKNSSAATPTRVRDQTTVPSSSPTLSADSTDQRS